MYPYRLPEGDYTLDRKVVIYGTGYYGKVFYEQLVSRYGPEIFECFTVSRLDANRYMDQPVCSLEDLQRIGVDRFDYIVASKASEREIIESLLALNVPRERIFSEFTPTCNVNLHRIGDWKNVLIYAPVMTDYTYVLIENALSIIRQMNRVKSIRLTLAIPDSNINVLESAVTVIAVEDGERRLEEYDAVFIDDADLLDSQEMRRISSKLVCLDPDFYRVYESSIPEMITALLGRSTKLFERDA